MAVLLLAIILFGFQTAVGSIQTLPRNFHCDKSVGTLAGFTRSAATLAVVVLGVLIPRIAVNAGRAIKLKADVTKAADVDMLVGKPCEEFGSGVVALRQVESSCR